MVKNEPAGHESNGIDKSIGKSNPKRMTGLAGFRSLIATKQFSTSDGGPTIRIVLRWHAPSDPCIEGVNPPQLPNYRSVSWSRSSDHYRPRPTEFCVWIGSTVQMVRLGSLGRDKVFELKGTQETASHSPLRPTTRISLRAAPARRVMTSTADVPAPDKISTWICAGNSRAACARSAALISEGVFRKGLLSCPFWSPNGMDSKLIRLRIGPASPAAALMAAL